MGEEAQKEIYPQGVARNFTLTYTKVQEKMDSESIDSTLVVAVLTSPKSEDFDNLNFPYRTCPDGLQVDVFDKDNNKTVIKGDYGILYSATNLIDLRGNVVIETHKGQKLETTQLYYDGTNEWIFTQEKFTYNNPEDGTLMDGEGMDFNKEGSFLTAHKVYGLILIEKDKIEEDKDE